jgi:transposase-like protein
MLAPIACCPHCGSEHLVSNGHAKNGRLRFHCKDCKKYGRQDPGSAAYDAKTKAIILVAYHERTSYHERTPIRGLRRIFGVSRNTVAAWLERSE